MKNILNEKIIHMSESKTGKSVNGGVEAFLSNSELQIISKALSYISVCSNDESEDQKLYDRVKRRINALISGFDIKYS